MQIILNILHQCLNALGIVTTVNNEKRRMADHIKSTGPFHILHSVSNVLLIDVPANYFQSIHNREHHGSVVELVVTQQRENKILSIAAVKYLTVQGMLFKSQGIKVSFHKLDMFFGTNLLIYRLYRRCAPIDNSIAVFFENTGFRFCNLLYGITQDLCVVKTNVCDNRHFRCLDYIGCVKCAAHADLQNDDVTLLSNKVFKSNAANQLKFGRRFCQRLCKGFYVFRNFG